MQHFSREELKQARRTDLYQYLVDNHPDEIIYDWDSIRPIVNHSISIKTGYSGYTDFSTGETGNAIDFLVRYMGYDIVDAVFALCGYSINKPAAECLSPIHNKGKVTSDKIVLPEPGEAPYRQMYAYLLSRGIERETITALVKAGLVYQEVTHNNIVFANAARDWAEIRGTNTYLGRLCVRGTSCLKYQPGNNRCCALMDTCESYKRNAKHYMAKGARTDGFWWFGTGDNPQRAYICEGSIDAISLYELHRLSGDHEAAIYVSIGGAGKQAAIDRISAFKAAIIAVDNDDAGAVCRARNPFLDAVIPRHKDWNEDLQYVRR